MPRRNKIDTQRKKLIGLPSKFPTRRPTKMPKPLRTQIVSAKRRERMPSELLRRLKKQRKRPRTNWKRKCASKKKKRTDLPKRRKRRGTRRD